MTLVSCRVGTPNCPNMINSSRTGPGSGDTYTASLPVSGTSRAGDFLCYLIA